MKVTEGGGFAFSNLEDIPCTPEETQRHLAMFAERRRKHLEKKKLKKAKIK